MEPLFLLIAIFAAILVPCALFDRRRRRRRHRAEHAGAHDPVSPDPPPGVGYLPPKGGGPFWGTD